MHLVLLLKPRRHAMDVAHGCVQIDMAELLLNGQQARPAAQHIRRQGVPHQVRVNTLQQPGPLGHGSHQFTDVLLLQLVLVADRQKHRIGGISSAAGQVLDHDAEARGRDSSRPLFELLGAVDVEHLGRPVQVTDAQDAKLLVTHAGVGQEGKNGLLTKVRSRTDETRHFSLGEGSADHCFGLFRAPQMDGDMHEGSVSFERDRRVHNVRVRGSFLAHFGDEFVHRARRRPNAQDGHQTPHCREIIADRGLAQADLGGEVDSEVFEDGVGVEIAGFRGAILHRILPHFWA